MHLTQLTSLAPAELTASRLSGATIFGPSQERIGHVCAVHGSGAEARVLVDLQSGGGRRVALPLQELSFSRDASNALRADSRWSRADMQVLSLPQG